jgi:hypothetical protein
MQLKYYKSILPAADAFQKVTSLAWAPNKCVLGCGTANRRGVPPATCKHGYRLLCCLLICMYHSFMPPQLALCRRLHGQGCVPVR